MTKETLDIIKRNIRENFNKTVTYPYGDPRKMNCYMYAVFCEIPTEVYLFEYNGKPLLQSTIKEEEAYFSKLGGFSKTHCHRHKNDVVQSLKMDLDVLGLLCRECEYDEPTLENEAKIALYFRKEINEEVFHFIRQKSDGTWWHKNGWTVEIEEIEDIESFKVEMDLIGFFLISLKEGEDTC